jgi:hypothetical protein
MVEEVVSDSEGEDEDITYWQISKIGGDGKVYEILPERYQTEEDAKNARKGLLALWEQEKPDYNYLVPEDAPPWHRHQGTHHRCLIPPFSVPHSR